MILILIITKINKKISDIKLNKIIEKNILKKEGVLLENKYVTSKFNSSEYLYDEISIYHKSLNTIIPKKKI